MDGILLLAHGSRRPGAEKVLQNLAEKVKERSNAKLIYLSYMQFSNQNLKVGIEKLIYDGADNIKVVPLFLFEGVHVINDIPKEIAEIKEKHPEVDILLTKHIGDDERLVEIILDRVEPNKKENYSFFRNKACEYFPCHKTNDPENFNCLFCYCPLYALGDECGGNFSYTSNGIKNCENCLFPHKRENYDAVNNRFGKIVEKMEKLRGL